MKCNFLRFLIIIVCIIYAKSTPSHAQSRRQAFYRAAALNNSISISWLEQTWNPGALNKQKITDADLKLLTQLGFKGIRLPVAFEYYEKRKVPLNKVLARIDQVWRLCKRYQLKLIIDYHGGSLNDTNYVSQTQLVTKIWHRLMLKYANTAPDDLFFELYNEPPHMNPDIWKDLAYNVIRSLRKVDNQRTFIVGASNYNSIYELSRFVRLADENIIYTFHYYEPFLFTHQGAPWVGNQVATVGVPFPYNVEKFPALNSKAKNTPGELNYYKYKNDGNEPSVKDKLQIAKNWSAKYYVPVICGEYGVYNRYADLDSRCRYIKTVRIALKQLGIPGILWDYDTNFSLFNGQPSLNTLPVCMQKAIDNTN